MSPETPVNPKTPREQSIPGDPATPVDQPTAGPVIRISRGVGSGRTRLAAFDSALRDAGIGDFNLIRLSSVIPAGSTIKEVGAADQISGEHGDALYCVYAESFASTPHSEAWAGLAWSERDDGSGAGLFVEHAGMSEAQVLTDLDLTLEDLSAGRGGRYRSAGLLLAHAECVDHPVCAVAVATYGRGGWSAEGPPRLGPADRGR